MASFLLRVYRWQLILNSAQPVGFWQAFHPLMIGFMLNCILPGRAGEIARPLILNQKDHFPFSTGLATVAAERSFDAIVLLMLFSWMLLVVHIDPDLEISFTGYVLNKTLLMSAAKGISRVGFILLTGIILVSLDPVRNRINGLISRIPEMMVFTSQSFRKVVYERFSLVLIRFLENFAKGFQLLKDPWKMAGCFFLSVLIWGLSALSYYTMAMGAPGIDLSLAEISVVMVIVCLFISIPSAPGYWGIWEAGGVFALALFHVSAKDAAGFTLANHVFQMLPVFIVGIGSAIVTGVNVWKVSHGVRE